MREDEGTQGARAEVANAASQVVDEAKRATAAAKVEAADLVGTARDAGMRRAEAGREQVAERLESFAGNIHEASRDLRRNEAWLAELLDKGAQELSGLAGTLQSRDIPSLVDGLQSFARRQPALFAGASVALGFAAVRLARSAAERQGESARAHPSAPPLRSMPTVHSTTSPGHGRGLHEASGGYAPMAREGE